MMNLKPARIAASSQGDLAMLAIVHSVPDGGRTKAFVPLIRRAKSLGRKRSRVVFLKFLC
jgi:hypothetical protein